MEIIQQPSPCTTGVDRSQGVWVWTDARRVLIAVQLIDNCVCVHSVNNNSNKTNNKMVTHFPPPKPPPSNPYTCTNHDKLAAYTSMGKHVQECTLPRRPSNTLAHRRMHITDTEVCVYDRPIWSCYGYCYDVGTFLSLGLSS